MCGTVGVFVGCPMVSLCPTALLKRSGRNETTEYRSPFGSWDHQAAARSARRPSITDEFVNAQAFPDALTPALHSATLADLPAESRSYLKIQQLYRYLEFTAQLEHIVVNRTAMSIAHGRLGISLPGPMRLDAFKIYVDEAYHALMVAEIRAQVELATGINPTLPKTPSFLIRLQQLVTEHPGHRALVELMFVIVSETLITASLGQVGRSADVDPGVARMMKDHARDEGRHHIYFRQLAEILWHQLGSQERSVVGRVLPELVLAFTSPEITATRDDLKYA